ncbi:MAG: hypothetical protein WD080_04435 [Egibacteraceae bacterium]
MAEDPDDSGTELPSPARRGPVDDAVAGPFPDRPGRPTFARLEVDASQEEPVVEVTLTIEDRRLVGRATGPATGDESARTAAIATLEAVRELFQPGVHAELGWLDIVDDPDGERPRYATSGVHCTGARGRQTFLGSALASGDPRVAAVRATLDALNRPLRIWYGETSTP